MEAVARLFEGADFPAALVKTITRTFANHHSKLVAVCTVGNTQFLLKVYAPDVFPQQREGLAAPVAELEILRALGALDTPGVPILLAGRTMTAAEHDRTCLTAVECFDKKSPLCAVWHGEHSGFTKGPPTFIAMEAGYVEVDTYARGLTTPSQVWTLKSLVWMVLYTLHEIRQKFPKFVHGDMYLRNVILYIDTEFVAEDRLTTPHVMEFDDAALGRFYVPYSGLVPKIIDYELASLDRAHTSASYIRGQHDDVLQLMTSLLGLYQNETAVSQLVNTLMGTDKLKPGMEYAVVSELFKGTAPKTLTELLTSPAFGYDKKTSAEIWGTW